MQLHQWSLLNRICACYVVLSNRAVKRRPRTSFPRKISKETYKKKPLLRNISDLKSKRSQISVKGPKVGNRKNSSILKNKAYSNTGILLHTILFRASPTNPEDILNLRRTNNRGFPFISIQKFKSMIPVPFPCSDPHQARFQWGLALRAAFLVFHVPLLAGYPPSMKRKLFRLHGRQSLNLHLLC